MELETVRTDPPDILVVDDTPENLQLLTGMLKKLSYKVRPVRSGPVALQAARHDPPDLILLDISMPEMNGYEVCAQAKADIKLKDIPVIFISALDDPPDKVRAFEVGGVDYITKPFKVEEVAARVNAHLQLRLARERLAKSLQELHADIELATQIQGVLLPAQGPHVFDCGLRLVARYIPQQAVGGDFFDFAVLDEQRVAIVLADVSGHGLQAAFVTGVIKTSFVLAGECRRSPEGFARELNRLLCELTPDDSFATMVYCVYDAACRTLHYLNAGHSPFPILALPGEEPRPLSRETNLGLGIIELKEFAEETLALPCGTTLLLATDGVTETYSPGGEQFGYDRLLATVRAQSRSIPSELDQAVFDEVTRFRGSTVQSDDIAMVTMQFD
jgi:serine phosphatase RsbU (regulator of sigma subunit)